MLWLAVRRWARRWVIAVCALLLAASGAVVGAELEFSHQLHLANGLNCSFCHSAAQTSTAETDHLLPDAQLCLACHNGQTAPEIDVAPLRDRQTAERRFWFDHQQHLVLESPAARIADAIDSGAYLGPVPAIRDQLDVSNACAACHRGLDQAVRVNSSLHLPRMPDCLVCHDQIDNPFSCEQCHAEEVSLKPADHTREFIDRHSSGRAGLDKLSCQPCHGRRFTCMGCH